MFDSNAAANIKLSGLGIITYNEDEGRSEEAVIRQADHKFTLKIKGPGDFKPSDVPGPAGYCVDMTHHFDVENIVITIAPTRDNEIQGVDLQYGREFDRLGMNNDNDDLRWVLNMEGELHENQMARRNAPTEPRPPIARTYVENAKFFAIMPEDPKAEEYPFFYKVDQDGNEEPLGYLAETIGANLFCSSFSVTIESGGKKQYYEFDRVPGLPYIIEIENMSENAPVSDLDEVYKFIEDSQNPEKRFELITKEDQSAQRGEELGGKKYCHKVSLDQPSINFFL